jgi:uncharacterized protein (DUF4415 family)
VAEERIEKLLGKDSEGRAIILTADGEIIHREDQTDWARLDALTDEDIKAAMADDPDWAGFEEIDWSTIEVKPFRPKQAISIRLDPDILDFFKAEGAGYQGRINTVLRHYMESKRKAG